MKFESQKSGVPEMTRTRRQNRLGFFTGLLMAALPTDVVATDVGSVAASTTIEQPNATFTTSESRAEGAALQSFVAEMKQKVEQSPVEVGGIAVIDKSGHFIWSYTGISKEKNVYGLNYHNFEQTEVGHTIAPENIATIIQFHTHPPLYRYAPPSGLDVGQEVFDAPPGVPVEYVAFAPEGVWQWDVLTLAQKEENALYPKLEELVPEAQSAYSALFGAGEILTQPTSRGASLIAQLLDSKSDEEIREIYTNTQADDTSHYLTAIQSATIMRDRLFRYSLLVYPDATYATAGTMVKLISEDPLTAKNFTTYADAVKALEIERYEALLKEQEVWRHRSDAPNESDFRELYQRYADVGVTIQFTEYETFMSGK